MFITVDSTMLNQITVKMRLLLLALIPLVVLTLVTLIAIHQMQTLNAGIGSLYNDRIQPLRQIKEISDAYAVTMVDTLHKHKAGLIAQPEAQRLMQQAERHAADFWQAYLNTELTAEERRLVQQAETVRAPFLQQMRQFNDKLQNNSLQDLPAERFNQQLYDAADPLIKALNALILLQLEESQIFRQKAQQAAALFRSLFSWSLSMVILLLGVMAWLTYKSIHRPLLSLQDAIEQVGAKLDLRIRATIAGKDELAVAAQSFNSTQQRLQQFFAELAQAITQLAAAAEEMNNISDQVSGTAYQQEHKATLIATAVTEMSAAIQEVAGSALRTSEQANETDSYSQQGYQSVRENLSAIGRLSESLAAVSAVITNLNSETDKISQVLAVIRTIAEQTNLLALNAAIEAARAGDAGRGFAVVADEVRQLATNTQKATESIRGMIENLQGSSQAAVSSMQASENFAQASVSKAKEAGEVIELIKSSVSSIVDMNVQISTATEEQTIVAEDISKNISDFTVSIGEVTHSAKQSAKASSMLAQLAAKLQLQAAAFKI